MLTHWSYVFLAQTMDIYRTPTFLFTMPADVLAPLGAGPSAGTVLITKLHRFSTNFVDHWWFQDISFARTSVNFTEDLTQPTCNISYPSMQRGVASTLASMLYPPVSENCCHSWAFWLITVKSSLSAWACCFSWVLSSMTWRGRTRNDKEANLILCHIYAVLHIYGLMQERRNSIANTLELCFSWGWMMYICVSKLTISLVQIMACRLDGAKPLSEPILEYC